MNICKANMPQTDASKLEQLVSDKALAVTRSMANSKEQELSQLIGKENIG